MITMHRLAGRLAASLLLALAALSQSTPARAQGSAGSSLWLQGAGATFPAPLYAAWIDAFQKNNPGISITYDVVGSGEGISRFVTGSVDFGATDSALRDEQMSKVQRGVVLVPATAGMVVLAYNIPGFSGALKLPRDVYVDIFSGKVRRWDDPRIQQANPELTMPKRNIALITRQDRSGTTYALTNNFSAVSEAWRKGPGIATLVTWSDNAMQARGNEGVAARIKISENSIGYVEYGFAKRLGLPVAALQNMAGTFVKPTEVSGQLALAEAKPPAPDDMRLVIADPAGAQSYPIVTYSWLMLNKQYPDARKGAAIRDFVTWGLTDGQKLGGQFGYIPLPAEVASQGVQAVAAIR